MLTVSALLCNSAGVGAWGPRADLVTGTLRAASVCFLCGHSIQQEVDPGPPGEPKMKVPGEPSPGVDTDGVCPWPSLDSAPSHLTVLLRPEKDKSASLLRPWLLRVLGAHVTGQRWG